MNIGSFFFLRPQWLLLIIALIALFTILQQRSKNGHSSDWKGLIDDHLLQHLSISKQGLPMPRYLIAALTCGMIASIIAMAGPTWEKNQVPTFKSSEPIVLVLSLAQSMNASDITPSRLTRATHKINDIIKKNKSNEIGLVIYSDRPFVASPLTSDPRIIKDMLPELTPDLMPVLGNRLDLAINQGSAVLTQAGARDGKIIIIANDASDRLQESIAAAKSAVLKGYTVDVLGIGTLNGSELITASGQLFIDNDNNSITTKLEKTALSSVAQAGNGQFVDLTADSKDIHLLLGGEETSVAVAFEVENGKPADDWNDVGFWLLFIPVLLAPLAFQRGLLMSLPILLSISLSMQTPSAQASVWQDLWETPDQQAQQAFEKEDFSTAAKRFQNPTWKASALYKAGDFDKSAKLYSELSTEDQLYNLGNALAKAGKLEQAIETYNAALSVNPNDTDAQFNRDLLKNILEQQKQEQEQEQEQEQSNQNSDKPDQKETGKQDQQSDNSSQAKSGQQSDQQKDSTNKPSDQDQSAQQDGSQGKPSQQQDTSAQHTQTEESASANQQDNSSSQTYQSASDQDRHNQEQDSKTQITASSEKKNLPTADANQQETASSKPADLALQNLQAEAKPESGQFKKILKKTMDELFQGNSAKQNHDDPSEQSNQSNQAATNSELNQAAEQLLRTVPDNTSGLLKARIRQHYRQLSETHNNG